MVFQDSYILYSVVILFFIALVIFLLYLRLNSNAKLSKLSKPEDEELRRLLIKLDSLLEKLPSGEIENFAKSEEFKGYKRIIGKLNRGK